MPAEAMRALINFEDTLLAYRDLEPATPVANLDEQTVAQVIEIYLRWKAVAIQALVLNRHGIDPASDSGKLLGARWQDYLDFTTATGSAGDLAERSQSGFESWPYADRDLHDATRDYLHACHRHHISEGTK